MGLRVLSASGSQVRLSAVIVRAMSCGGRASVMRKPCVLPCGRAVVSCVRHTR